MSPHDRLRRLYFGVLPLVFLAVVVVLFGFAALHPVLAFLPVVIWLGLLFGLASRATQVMCPRCGERLVRFHTPVWIPRLKHCPSCGRDTRLPPADGEDGTWQEPLHDWELGWDDDGEEPP